jgi:hypothetical protein
MPAFKYTGADERYYPSLSLLVQPGDSVTLDHDPGDGRFVSTDGAPAPAPVAPAPVPVPAPVADSAPADSPEVGV